MLGSAKPEINENHFFFLISFTDIKKGHPSKQGVYRVNNQVQKLQESRKSRKEVNDWFCKATNHFENHKYKTNETEVASNGTLEFA